MDTTIHGIQSRITIVNPLCMTKGYRTKGNPSPKKGKCGYGMVASKGPVVIRVLTSRDQKQERDREHLFNKLQFAHIVQKRDFWGTLIPFESYFLYDHVSVKKKRNYDLKCEVTFQKERKLMMLHYVFFNFVELCITNTKAMNATLCHWKVYRSCKLVLFM